MFSLLILLFILIPLLEIYLLIHIGSGIGALPTITLILGTAVLGAILLRFQGRGTLAKIKQDIILSQLPALSLLEGLVLCIAGVLLLTPGFLTDLVGFLFLVPAVRSYLVFVMTQKAMISQGKVSRQPQGDQHVGGNTLEGEFWEHKKP